MLKHIAKIVWKNKRQNGLLLFELFISLIILTTVFAYLLTNIEKVSSPLGFETEDRYLVLFYDNSAEDSAAYVTKIDNLQRALKQMPQVLSVSFGNTVYPFSGNNWQTGVMINNVNVPYLMASMDENYQGTMGLKMHAGRWYTKPLDTSDNGEVVINKKFYDNHFSGQDVIDSVMELLDGQKIVGIVEHYKYNGEFVDEDNVVLSYVDPHNAVYAQSLYVHVQPNTPPEIEQELSRVVFESTGIIDFNIRNLDETRKIDSRPSWVAITALSALSIFLVINVAMGLFGVLWTNVKRRHYEISLRKALGASQYHILGQFMLESTGLVLLALVAGSAIVLQIIHFNLISDEIRHMHTGLVFAGLFIFLLVIACALYPAWRAARFEPAEGLKDE
jgi:putative ABC transport system permease protein